MGDFILMIVRCLKWRGNRGFEILDGTHNIPFATLSRVVKGNYVVQHNRVKVISHNIVLLPLFR